MRGSIRYTSSKKEGIRKETNFFLRISTERKYGNFPYLFLNEKKRVYGTFWKNSEGLRGISPYTFTTSLTKFTILE